MVTPCAASRETVKRSDLAGHAGYGYCASHSRYFWGFRLYLVSTADGLPISWGLAHPRRRTGGHLEVTTALLRRDHHLIRGGQVILDDKGFAGRDFEAFVTDQLGAHLLRPDRKGEPPRHGKLARYRQWIEAIFDTLKGPHPRTARRPHPGRRLHPRRHPPARPGRRHLAQLAHRRPRQTLPHRLRPLKINRTHSSSVVARPVCGRCGWHSRVRCPDSPPSVPHRPAHPRLADIARFQTRRTSDRARSSPSAVQCAAPGVRLCSSSHTKVRLSPSARRCQVRQTDDQSRSLATLRHWCVVQRKRGTRFVGVVR